MSVRHFRRSLIFLPLAVAMLPATPDASPPQYAFLKAYPVEVPIDAPAPAPPTKQQHPARTELERKSLLDPDNPDLGRLQRHDEAVAGLPTDANGFPDWMQSLERGLIRPRNSVTGDAPPDVLDLDIIMKRTKEMPWVRFPHRSHTLWLGCGNCHPEPFEARAGSTPIGMADIFRGKYCGMCHDRVAFITFYSCARCHGVARTPAP